MWIKLDNEHQVLTLKRGSIKIVLVKWMNVSHATLSRSPRAGTDSVSSALVPPEDREQLWACFLEADLQNPKYVQHFR